MLISGSDLNLSGYAKYKSPPLGWAIHGWGDPPAGNSGKQLEVILLLVAAQAAIESQWLESEKVRADPVILSALRIRTL